MPATASRAINSAKTAVLESLFELETVLVRGVALFDDLFEGVYLISWVLAGEFL
jgi:hypothetical protein